MKISLLLNGDRRDEWLRVTRDNNAVLSRVSPNLNANQRKFISRDQLAVLSMSQYELEPVLSVRRRLAETRACCPYSVRVVC